jgi:cell division protein FtsB
MQLTRFAPFVPWMFLGAAAVGAGLLIFGEDGIRHNRTLAAELENQRAHNGVLRENIEHARRSVRQLETSSQALERAARNELGMAKPDDIIFLFPLTPTENSNAKSER